MWTNCKGKVLDIICFGKGNLCILALIQYVHSEQTSSLTEILTILLKEDKADWKSLEQGCPSLWCHSNAWGETALFTNDWNAKDEEGMGVTDSWEERGIG